MSLCVNALQFVIWSALVVVSTIMIENVGQSGYASYLLEDSAAEKYIEDNCDLDSEQIIWVDYSLDIPSWMLTTTYQIYTIVGAALSVIEFFLCFVVYYCGDGMKIVDTKAAIELADTSVVPLGTTVDGVDEDGNVKSTSTANGVVPLETADENENDVSYHESDDDVLYDDEEKEMEYVTPGGPTPP